MQSSMHFSILTSYLYERLDAFWKPNRRNKIILQQSSHTDLHWTRFIQKLSSQRVYWHNQNPKINVIYSNSLRRICSPYTHTHIWMSINGAFTVPKRTLTYPAAAVWLLWTLSLRLPAGSYRLFCSFLSRLYPQRLGCNPSSPKTRLLSKTTETTLD